MSYTQRQLPVYAELVSHLKKLDGFNEDEMKKLKSMVAAYLHKHIDENCSIESLGQEDKLNEKEILSIALMIHQTLALVMHDQDAQAIHGQNYHQVLQVLQEKNGPDYLPRERTPQGRVFEHACAAKNILMHLIQNQVQTEEGGFTMEPFLTIQLTEDKEEKQDGGKILVLKKVYVDLTYRANGKTDLYFHAYMLKKYAEYQYLSLKSEHTAEMFKNYEVANNASLQRMQGLENVLSKVALGIKKFKMDETQYNQYVQLFGGNTQYKKQKVLEEIQKYLFVAQIWDHQPGLYWIEKLLIQMLGSKEIMLRDHAVVMLHQLYDSLDWQLTSAFRPVIRTVGQHINIQAIVDFDMDKDTDSQIFLGLSAPSPIDLLNQSFLTWHKVDKRNMSKTTEGGCYTQISINFGKFWKCGFYDWRLISVNSAGKVTPLENVFKPEPLFPAHVSSSSYDNQYEDDDDDISNLAQGRFIVHAKGMRDHIFHESQVDFESAILDPQGKFIQRGSFEKVTKKLANLKNSGVTALYLMGCLERDNREFKDKDTNQTSYWQPDASALAITSRSSVNKMLGGKDQFKSLVSEAKSQNIKVLVDTMARISSSRHHRKYKDLLLSYLDQLGRRHICYGTDGHSINFEDTAMLNYRKKESWDLLIQETVDLISEFEVDGIHLDNGQAWPQIMEPDLDELHRLDDDGKPAYTPMEILDGEVVLRNENHGFWNTNSMEQYPNPFYIKMCKKLWEKNPNLMIISECQGGFMFEHRQIILARSGVVPRLYQLPRTLIQMFGKTLHRDGRIEDQQKGTITQIKQWYDKERKFLPEGSILLQSSTSHNWPYPAYMYGKGTWAAIDIQYFMSDIPITFQGEVDGEVYRVGAQHSHFQHEQQNTQHTSGLKKSNSQILMALKQKHSQRPDDITIDDDIDSSDNENTQDTQNTVIVQEKVTHKDVPSGKGMVKVRSGTNLAAVVQETQDVQDLKKKESMYKEQIKQQYGHDLKKIYTHYQNRRQLRREKMVLRYGQLVMLNARQSQSKNEFLPQVLAYARFSLMETAIIATNINDKAQDFYIDLTELEKLLMKTYSKNTVIMVTNMLDDSQPKEYFFLREFINKKSWQFLEPYRSSVLSITICQQDDKYIFQSALQQSIDRTKEKLIKKQNIESEQISLLIGDLIQNDHTNVHKFANIIGSLQQDFLDLIQHQNNVDFNQFFANNWKLRDNAQLSARFMALSETIAGKKQAGIGEQIAPIKAALSVKNANNLGPIVFCTPELGRWSTVGGLGVMVDELSVGLAALGQEIIVISPYYDRNRKGQSGYLAKDPAGIEYVDNISVNISGQTMLGVHEGEVSNVKVVFLHNETVFPAPYPDGSASFTMKQLSVFGKACLEYLCVRQIMPSVCITNDWFTALIPAYAKVGAFGDVFKGTTFLHICHNLQETYEGRIFPSPHEGALESVHQLPRDWLVDPSWGSVVVNPSRCAIMLSDQWSTVSKSYRDDLLNSSPLAPLLKQKTQPFAYPNGIPIEARIKKLDACAPNHKEAKKLLQAKYFNYQEFDDTVPLFAFVGRVVAQKGVHLILDVAENIIKQFKNKVHFIVGGPANMKDPYAAGCAHRMIHLKNTYPNSFWAAPDEFFTDGSLVNRGTDFGLMPSVFEPGGIVQHEFFVGATPVIAFKTGGLKDSVIEYNWDNQTGSGFTFEQHSPQDFIFAIERAIGVFNNKTHYQKLRQNAFQATMSGEEVCKAWLQEFFRLRNKIYTDFDMKNEASKAIASWQASDYKEVNIIEEIFGQEKKTVLNQLFDIDMGAEEEHKGQAEKPTAKILSQFEQKRPNQDKKPHVFKLHNYGPRHQQVQLIGSFDNWNIRHNMMFDHFTNQWFITMHLKKGDYFYKYVINGTKWVTNDEEQAQKDHQGNINNFVKLQ